MTSLAHAREAIRAASLLFAGALGAQAPLQRPFDPFPPGSAIRYHFDLARNFFRTPDDETAERQLLVSRLERLQQLSQRLPQTADGLLGALRLEDSLNLEVDRHTTYLELEYNADTRKAEALQAAGELRASAGQRFSAFDSALAARPDSTVSRMERVQPALRRYRFSVDNIRRLAGHRVTPAGARALEALGPMAAGAGGQLFMKTLNGTDFGFVQTATGPLSVARDFQALAASPDPRLRRESYKRNESGLAEHRELYADILVRTATALNAAARLKGYTDYADESYSARFLDREQVLRFLKAIAAAADVNKQIERAAIDHFQRAFQLDTVHPWDLFLPEPGMDVPRFTIDDASRVVLEATRPLGTQYAVELSKLLDPANGRLDLAPAANRANRSGFSAGSVGFPSFFYQGAFSGYTEDVVVLAHESGHAVQNMLMSSHHVLPRYASGPAYFTESFAGLCELLVLDHLYRTAPDRAHRIFFLQRLINQGAEVFRTSWESLVEQQLYDSAATGRQLTADGIEALTQATASRFSVWFGPGSEKQLLWLQPTQFFTRPLYRVNYVYSKLLALRYFDLFHRQPATFPRRYGALLANGYDATPDALLRRFVDTRIGDQALIDGAVRVLAAWLAELKTLYDS